MFSWSPLRFVLSSFNYGSHAVLSRALGWLSPLDRSEQLEPDWKDHDVVRKQLAWIVWLVTHEELVSNPKSC